MWLPGRRQAGSFERNSVKPRILHSICAHPLAISWCLGAAAIDIAIVSRIADGATDLLVVFQSGVILPLLVSLISGTLLAFLPSVVIYLPLSSLCRKFNGAPFRVGDSVLILSGPHKGTMAEVYGTTVGQGGEKLLKLSLAPKYKEQYWERSFE